jgi:hypothetical protein
MLADKVEFVVVRMNYCKLTRRISNGDEKFMAQQLDPSLLMLIFMKLFFSMS